MHPASCILLSLLLPLLLLLPLSVAAQIDCSFTQPGQALVRVSAGDKRLLLLPVEESQPDAELRVLCDAQLQRTLRVRLASTEPDYYVPLDLTPYQGRQLLLDVRLDAKTNPDPQRADSRTCWKLMQLADTFSTANREKWRPAYHHTPQWGWMNDPNGMFYKDGLWHLYYQHNPYGSLWQNLSWGHSVSRDLLHWQPQSEALEPQSLGLIFSGSCVLDTAGTAGLGAGQVIALYTACDASQVQCLASSEDGGQTFKPYPGNPVIAYPRETRDPNMFWNAERGEWVLLLASALDHEMLIFTSPNLREWTLQSKFGQGYGSQQGVWECPDLMRLPVLDGKGRVRGHRWVLICNINPGSPQGGSGTQYFVGDFDGHTFTCSTPPEAQQWLDYGKDHYAAVSWAGQPQGRHTVIAWMSNWQYADRVPTRQFRSANTLPRELSLFRDALDGRYYVAAQPAPEAAALRAGGPSQSLRRTALRDSLSLPLQGSADGLYELCLDLRAGGADSLTITLSNDLGQQVSLDWNGRARTLAMDRTRSGLTSFAAEFPARTVGPTHAPRTDREQLRLLLDRCSVEAFTAGGRLAMTNLVFPTQPYNRLTLTAHGRGAVLQGLGVYPLTVK